MSQEAGAGPCIDTTQIETGKLSERRFPASGKLRVCIARQAHELAWRQALASVQEARKTDRRPVEVGGLLLGDLWRDEAGPFLEIVAVIPAEHTRNEGTQMTFTPETWAQVNRERDRHYPQTKMVGWYHTHPNFGIFLSDMDKFIHQHHFSQPWATALVLDPVRETEGFFIWNDGEPRPVNEYWVGTERRDRHWVRGDRYDETPEPVTASHDSPSSAVSRATFALVSALSFLALLFLFGYVYMREVGHTETEKFVLQAIEAQKTELQSSAQVLADLHRDLENSRAESRSTRVAMEQKIQRVQAGLAGLANVVQVLQQRVSAEQADLPARPGEVQKQ